MLLLAVLCEEIYRIHTYIWELEFAEIEEMEITRGNFQAETGTYVPSLAELLKLDYVPAPLILLDAVSAAVIYANDAAKKLAGGDLPQNLDQEEFRRAALGVHFKGEEIRFTSARGTKIPVLIYSKSVPAMDGHGAAVIVVLHDQRALSDVRADLVKSQQRAEVAERAKSWFLANISHEIRTPLNAILGFSELLSAGAKRGSEKFKFMEAIRRNGEILSRLVTDVLDLAKIDSENLELRSERLSPRDLAAEVIDNFNTRATEKCIELAFTIEGAIPEFIRSDELRLRQILTNLVDNATKFTSRGHVRVTLSWLAEYQRLEYRIVDTGVGISIEHIPHLFRPFAQVDNSHTRKYGGSGLGLDISRRLARALGGDVVVERTMVRQGSTFCLWIPAAPLDGILISDSGPPQTVATKKIQKLSGARILVVEDAPDNRVLVGKFLTLAGATVEFAVNGLDGVEKALKKPFDIILMDIQMPELDGYEATAHLRWKKYQGPIVALTAHALAEERAKCFEVGCDDHLTKPIDRGVLVDTLARFLVREQQIKM